MRRFATILFLLLVVFSSVEVMAFSRNKSGAKVGHIDEARAVFSGFGKDEGFVELFDSISSEIDRMPYDLEKRYPLKKGFNGYTHRLIGHRQALDGETPEIVLKELEKIYGLPREEFIRYWRAYQERVWDLAMKCTGLPREEAKAFASLIWDVHLLGDIEPGNKVTALVLRPDEIVENMTRHVNTLLGRDSPVARQLSKKFTEILAAARKGALSTTETSELLMKALWEIDIGGAICEKFKGTIRLKWVKAVSDSAKAWIGGRISKLNSRAEKALVESVKSKLKKTPAAKAQTVSGKNVKLQKFCTKANIVSSGKTTARGFLQKVYCKDGAERYILSVHVTEEAFAGLSAGVLTFLIDEGITCVGYARGEMSEEQFYRETGKNCAKGIMTGAATYVAVALGATPGGWVVIGVGIGAYMLSDVVCDSICLAIDGPGFSIDDVIGELPTELQRRKGLFEYEGLESAFDFKGHESANDYKGQESVFDYEGGESAFDYESKERSFLDLGR